jgi:NDP-sugar pyrophosphorylase family protein
MIAKDEFVCIGADVSLGENVKLSKFINLYGCTVGANTKIGAFVEIQKNATVGTNCKISSHSFICEGVDIEDDVFIGHGVMFINDSYPRSTANGQLQTEADWKVETNARVQRCLDRHRLHHIGQRDHRRKRNHRCGQRHHERRPGKRYRCG